MGPNLRESSEFMRWGNDMFREGGCDFFDASRRGQKNLDFEFLESLGKIKDIYEIVCINKVLREI